MTTKCKGSVPNFTELFYSFQKNRLKFHFTNQFFVLDKLLLGLDKTLKNITFMDWKACIKKCFHAHLVSMLCIWLQDIILVCLQSWNLGITKFQWIFLWSRKVHDHQLFWRLLLQTVPESFGGRRSSIWSYLQISYVLLNPDYCSYLCRNFNNQD